MKNCEQMKGLSVLEHGFMVKNYTFDLINYLHGKPSKYTWSIPNIVQENKNLILKNLLPYSIIKEYTILHDLGKPYCLSIDSQGKRHFKNHEEISYSIYKNLPNANNDVSYLILHDMDLHLGKVDDFDPKFIYTQIVVSLAELHANAQMFGGIESTSFKIKLKKLTQSIKKILKNNK